MKKILAFIIICIAAAFTLSLTACVNDNSGTYYPKNSEMQYNLENGGYTVDVTTDLDGKSGTYLSATKESDYIYFYWVDNVEDCEYFYILLKENHSDYNSLVEIENDYEFGNIVYCGTDNAVNTAGIKVVKIYL